MSLKTWGARLPHQMLEPFRGSVEFGHLVTAVPRLLRAPRGDGHPVMVLPGFLASDCSTATLRAFLSDRGYDAHGWGLGINAGPDDQIEVALMERLRKVAAVEPVSLIGWSLGGVYAMELAGVEPSLVRQVITLGSPLNLVSKRGRAAPVPVSTVYSRSDAIISSRYAAVSPAPLRESIEVRGSHLGLGHNAGVLLVVADRLAQPAAGWKPYRQAA